MYVTSQVVHVTEDQGHSFEIISPDLSEMIQNYRRNGRITKDQTGAEVYATIFTSQNHR
jgi:competence protein ComGC